MNNKDIQTLIEREAEISVQIFSEDQRVSRAMKRVGKRKFIQGASFALSLFKWRKVSEELPPTYQDVIFKVNVFAETYHSEMASIGHIVHDGGYKLQIDLLARDILEYEITDWMPIPQID